jgi:peptidoglycan/LPS O-acetylase OafA/YrhL
MIPVSAIVFSNSPDSFSLYYALPAFRLPEFIAGIVAYHLMKCVRYSSMIRNILLLVLVSGVLHVILLGDVLPGVTLHNWIFIPAVCSALVLLFQSEETSSGLMTSRFMVWLGSISYCFYSFQFHVLLGLKALMPIELAGGWLYLCASFFILLSISALVHHYFEEPARVWLRTRAKKKLEMKATS